MGNWLITKRRLASAAVPLSKRKLGLILAAVLALTGAAFAFTFPLTVTGTLDNFTGPGFKGPGVVLIGEFTVDPGESTGWHHHPGPAWVILASGNGVTEDEGCGPRAVPPGSAFVEIPGKVHKVDNNGPGTATFYWATIYPQGGSAAIPDAGPPRCRACPGNGEEPECENGQH